MLVCELRNTKNSNNPGLWSWGTQRSRRGSRSIHGITGNWKEEVSSMRNHLLQLFPGREMGKLKSYVGMRFDIRKDGIFLHQKQFTEQVVRDFLGDMVWNTRTPLQKGADITPRTTTEQPLDIHKYPYRQVLGKILHLANMTRPNLANAAWELGKVAADPTMRHWKSMLHILRYMSNTPAYGLLYRNNKEELKMIGYSDSDFANDSLSRLSCTEYVIKLGNAVIDWTSRTQRTIATSTTKAEWTVLSTGTRHAEYLRGFINELGLNVERVTWWCDNT